VATTQGVAVTLALVVAAPLCWGVFAAKPPHIARLQLLGMHVWNSPPPIFHQLPARDNPKRRPSSARGMHIRRENREQMDFPWGVLAIFSGNPHIPGNLSDYE